MADWNYDPFEALPGVVSDFESEDDTFPQPYNPVPMPVPKSAVVEESEPEPEPAPALKQMNKRKRSDSITSISDGNASDSDADDEKLTKTSGLGRRCIHLNCIIYYHLCSAIIFASKFVLMKL